METPGSQPSRHHTHSSISLRDPRAFSMHSPDPEATDGEDDVFIELDFFLFLRKREKKRNVRTRHTAVPGYP